VQATVKKEGLPRMNAMVKTLQLQQTHQFLGATFMELFGWEIVQQFSTVAAEYETLRQSAGLVDLSCSGIFELKGDDRTRFLQSMVTNDIKSLNPGTGCYAAFLSPQGRTLADLRVFCLENSFLLTTEPSVRDKLVPTLSRYIIGDRPQLQDRSDDLALLSLQGPRAAELLNQLVSRPAAPEVPYDHFETSVVGEKMRICRVDRTTPGGYDLIVRREDLLQTWQSILEQGKPAGVQPVGFEGLNVHRIEAGIPYYGFDLDENTLPIEAGLEKTAISFNKGCYIGQESVARIMYRGHVNRKLAGLLLSSTRAATKGDKVFRGNQEVGWITSSGYSFSLRKPIGLGYLRRETLFSQREEAPGRTVSERFNRTNPIPQGRICL
jgi:glycine cleavage system T protein